MRRATVLNILFVVVFLGLVVSEATAFDGERKGFVMGLGLGAASVTWEGNAEICAGRELRGDDRCGISTVGAWLGN